MPQRQSADAYLRTQVMTAPPERLQLMLYDGAIRFGEQAKQAIADGDIEAVHNNLLRAQRIVTELISALRPEVDPSLCEKLSALYGFIYRRLVHANLHKDPKGIDDALRILCIQRETWVEVIAKATRERAEGQSPTESDASPQPTSTFNVTG